jgi:protein-disulfide isomerase
MNRRQFLVASVASTLPSAALAQERADPRRLPAELVNELHDLPGVVRLGASNPDVTLYEFFDYNCGFCRKSAAEVSALIRKDKGLQYVLVNFAVLSEQSILATRVALAFLQKKPKSYLAFHQKLFETRGIRDADQAFAVAEELGVKQKDLIDLADSDDLTNIITTTVKLGDTLGIGATPSFVLGNEMHVGFLGLEGKIAAIAAMRQCEKMACG